LCSVKTGRDGEADGAVWPAVYNGQNNVKVLKLLVEARVQSYTHGGPCGSTVEHTPPWITHAQPKHYGHHHLCASRAVTEVVIEYV